MSLPHVFRTTYEKVFGEVKLDLEKTVFLPNPLATPAEGQGILLKSVNKIFAPTQNTADYNKIVKAATTDKTVLKYGMNYTQNKLKSNNLIKLYDVKDGNVAFSRIGDAKKGVKQFSALINVIESLQTWIDAFLATHGTEGACKDVLVDLDNKLVDFMEELLPYMNVHFALVPASINKKEGGYFAYTMKHHEKLVDTAIKKNDATKLQDALTEWVGFKAYYVNAVGGAAGVAENKAAQTIVNNIDVVIRRAAEGLGVPVPGSAAEEGQEAAADAAADAPAVETKAAVPSGPGIELKSVGRVYAPSQNTAQYEIEIKKAVNARDRDVLEYGLDYCLNRTNVDGSKLIKSLELREDGKTPLKYARVSSYDKFDKEAEKFKEMNEKLTKWLNAFLDAHGAEEAAKETALMVDAKLLEFAAVGDIYLTAHEALSAVSRKSGQREKGHFDGSYDYTLKVINNTLAKDLSKESELKKLDKYKKELEGFEAYFKAEVSPAAYAIGKVYLDEVAALLVLVKAAGGAGAAAAEEKEALKKREKEADGFLYKCKSALSTGKDKLFRHDADNVLKAIQAYRDARVLLTPFEDMPKVAETLAKSDVEIEQLVVDVKSQMKDKLVREQIRKMNSCFNTAKDRMNKYRNEEALEELYQTKLLLNELATGEYADEKDVIDVVAKTGQEAFDFEITLSNKMTQRRADNAVREANSAMNFAKDKFNHYIFDKALEYLQTAKEKYADIATNGAINHLESVQKALAEFSEESQEFRSNYNATMRDRKAKESLRVVSSHFNRAKDHFDHHRYEKALESLTTFKELAVEKLEEDSEISNHETIAPYLLSYPKEVEEFEAKYIQTVVSRAASEELRVANSAFNTAQDRFDHHRYEEALTSLHDFVEKADEIASNELYDQYGFEDVKTFKAGYPEKVEAFKKVYKETVTQRAADRAISEVRMALNSAVGHLDHHRHEKCLEKIEVTKEKLDVLLTTDEFMEIEATLTFCDETSEKIYELEEKFTEVMHERAVSEAKRVVHSAVHSAKGHLDHCRFERCLQSITAAGEAITELQYIGGDDVADYIETTETEIADLEQQYVTIMEERRVTEDVRKLSSFEKSALDHMDHHRHEKALEAARNSDDQAIDMEYLTHATAVAEVKRHNEVWMPEFNALYTSVVTNKAFKEAARSANSDVQFARGHLDHHRYEKVLVHLQAANEKAADLTAQFQEDLKDQVEAFNTEFDATTTAIRNEYVETTVLRALTDRALQIHLAQSGATNKFDHHRHEAALGDLNKAQDLIDDLNLDISTGEFAESKEAMAKGTSIVAEFATWSAEFKQAYKETVTKNKLQSVIRVVGSHQQDAKRLADHYRFEDALGALSKVRDVLAELAVDEMFEGMPAVDACVKETTTWIQTFGDEVATIMAKREADDVMRKVNSLVTSLKDLMAHNRTDKFLIVLNDFNDAVVAAEDSLADYAPGAKFIAEIKAEVKVLVNEFNEKAFKSEISRKQSAAYMSINRSSDHLDHHRYESYLKEAVKSQEFVVVLAADDRFLENKEVNDWIAEKFQEMGALNVKYVKMVADRKASEHKSKIHMGISSIKNHMDHHRDEHVLKANLSTQEAIEDFAEDIELDHPDQKYIAASLEEVTQLMAEFSAKAFGKEVNGLINVVYSHFKSAQNRFDHNRFDDALVSLQKAKESATDLGVEKYDAVPEVETFFNEWTPKVAAFEVTYQNKVNKRAADEAMQKVHSAYSMANNYFNKNCNEKALEYLSTARDNMDGLDEFELIEGVQEYIVKINQDIDTLSATISEKLFARELAEAIQAVHSKKKDAERLFDHYAYEQSLVSFNEAQELFEAASEEEKFATQKAFIAFKAEYGAFAAKFQATYAETVFKKEVAAMDRKARSALNTAKTFMERNCTEKALEALQQALEESTDLREDAMYKELKTAKALDVDIKAVTAIFAEKTLKKGLLKALAASKKLSDRIPKLLARGQKDSAESVFVEARDAMEDVMADQMYHVLAEYQAFLVSFLVVAKSIGRKTIVDEEGATGGKKKKRGSGDTIETMIGNRFIKGQCSSAKDFKLNVISIGPAVHPKFFTPLKKLNEQNKILNKKFKELFKGLKVVEFMGDEPTIGFPSVGIGKYLENAEKWLKQVEGIDAKDEMTVGLRANFDEVKDKWVKSYAHWTRLDAAAHERYEMLWMLKNIQGIAERMETGLTGTMPCEVGLGVSGGYVVRGNSFGLDSFSGNKTMDYQLGPAALDLVKKYRARVQLLHDKYFVESGEKGFCNEKELLEALAAAELRILIRHPQHCIEQITKAGRDSGKYYMTACRRWPLARKYLSLRIDQSNKHHNRRREHEWTCKLIPDPYKGQTIDNAYEEKEDWYRTPAELVHPGAEDLKCRSLEDMSQSNSWSAFHKANAGKIIFTKKVIHQNDTKADTSDKFKYGDEIHGRAYWATALRNIPIGKDYETGAPVYGPEDVISSSGYHGGGGTGGHYGELLQFVYIDGKQIYREGQPEGSFTHFRFTGHRKDAKPGSEVDFYGYNQTCKLHIQQTKIEDITDEWNVAAARYASEFCKLSKGKHEVKVELKWQLISPMDNINAHPTRRHEPSYSSLMSVPIATGSFTIEIPSSPKKRDILPDRTVTMNTSDEKTILKTMSDSSGWGQRGNKTEEMLQVRMKSDWYEASFKTFEIEVSRDSVKWRKECVAKSRDFWGSMYRSPETGWDNETVALFDLAALGVRQRNPPNKYPVSNIAVGGCKANFEAELLSDAELKLIKRRCPEKLRRAKSIYKSNFDA